MKKKTEKGFTLIELITVIAIIGILGAILVPSIVNYVRKARIQAAIADTKVIRSAVETALVEHLMLSFSDNSAAFNKVLYLDQNPRNRSYERVGCFTSYSWYKYKKKSLNPNEGASQKIDMVIAGALDDAFSEEWPSGNQAENPMGYYTPTKNCADYLEARDTNFAIVVVYNRVGSVRMIQLYRKGILVTYVNGEYLVNTNSDAHFVGTGTWNTIYQEAGNDSPEEFTHINLSNQQYGSDGKLGRWYT